MILFVVKVISFGAKKVKFFILLIRRVSKISFKEDNFFMKQTSKNTKKSEGIYIFEYIFVTRSRVGMYYQLRY